MSPRALEIWHALQRSVIGHHEAIVAYNTATERAEQSRLLAESVNHGEEALRLLRELVAEMQGQEVTA